jgi:acyl-coenzyme A thioesterase PaaI-like protein
LTVAAFQDRIRDNHCWGCGADNPDGLHLKSEWEGDVAVAQWMPSLAHAAGPRHVLNGGIIATVLDCHGVCTAIADAYRREGRAIGSEPDLWFATTSIQIEYLRPTPIDAELRLVASIREADGKRAAVECSLEAAGKERARAVVQSVRVPDEWRHGSR